MRRAEEHPPPVSVAWEGGGATNMVSPSASQQGEGVMADTIERTETHRLIASNKVEGTAVYNLENEKLGTIVNVMIDKRSGQSDYADRKSVVKGKSVSVRLDLDGRRIIIKKQNL